MQHRSLVPVPLTSSIPLHVFHAPISLRACKEVPQFTVVLPLQPLMLRTAAAAACAAPSGTQIQPHLALMQNEQQP